MVKVEFVPGPGTRLQVARSCRPSVRSVGVEAIHPDDFVLDLCDPTPTPTPSGAALDQQAADLTHPGHSTNS